MGVWWLGFLGHLADCYRVPAQAHDIGIIHVSDPPEGQGNADLRIILPDTARPHEAALMETLKTKVFELDAVYRYGLVRFRLDFRPAEFFRERKIKQVVDTRLHMGV